ncbi:MAG: YwmB family TATA-box binding protein [Tissierella sp.]|uniref:YwmB family TATA-box binding protein n=1 Tax=Tissierella sp. TaxID=41274 RepID=UPI003F985331
MKKTIIFGLILILMLPFFSKADNSKDDLDVLEEILYDLEGQPTEVDIAFNGVIDDKFLGEKDISKLGEKLISEIGLVGEEVDPFILQEIDLNEYYSKMIIFEDNFSQINYDGYDIDENKISINLNSYLDEEMDKGETTLSISIIKNDCFFEKNDIIDKIEDIYKEFNCEVDVTSCLIGKIEGLSSKGDYVDKLNDSLENIKGNIVDEFSEEQFSSYTIYSPLIENYLTINKKKININLSMRYNRDEDYTYLWIGTPIITAGY